MKTLNLKRELIIWKMLLMPFIYAAVAWNSLPNQIPTHWGISGQPDDWGGKISILLMPVISLSVYLLFTVLPKLDPRKINYQEFPERMFKWRLLFVVYFTVISISLIYGGTLNDWSFHNKLFTSSIFVLLALVGNYMINLKPTWFIGIRTPWTLSSDHVWKQTHLVFGRIMFYGSLACFAISIFVQGAPLVTLMVVFVLGTAVFGYAYSYWLFKKEKETGAIQP